MENKLKELVNNSELLTIQKLRFNGFIDKYTELEDKKSRDVSLIESITHSRNVSRVILSNEDVIIYTVFGKDEWDVKYPFRSVYLNKDGKWKQSNTVSPSLDLAYLVYLQHKHLGYNSQFVDFAIKMLEITLPE